ncbi:MAG: fructose bisphosphate aldolase [Rhizobiaceae bacterium]|nr:fructose bisphosphate aldolase [Rhizobiaceae bacterium]
MVDTELLKQISTRPAFVAALDQSGGSTPGALRSYGISESDYDSEEEMFRLVHEMRLRIIGAPAFTGEKILAAILFEHTMDGEADGKPVPAYLLERGVLPIIKVDKGIASEANGISLLKPIADLDSLLKRAVALGMVGTKMRSVINLADKEGVRAIVDQQFDIARQISDYGLVPIVEPEVSIKSPQKAEAEALLRDEILRRLDALPDDQQVMLKLTLPTVADFYAPLARHERVARVVALSGGYSRDEACRMLAENHDMIASFSRALVEDLRVSMSDSEFDAALARSIDQIHAASTIKT